MYTCMRTRYIACMCVCTGWCECNTYTGGIIWLTDIISSSYGVNGSPSAPIKSTLELP